MLYMFREANSLQSDNADSGVKFVAWAQGKSLLTAKNTNHFCENLIYARYGVSNPPLHIP